MTEPEDSSEADARRGVARPLMQRLAMIGEIGRRREADWRRFYAKLHRRMARLLKRVGIQEREIERLNKRSEKLQQKLSDERERIAGLKKELGKRLPLATVRMQVGRMAVIRFDEKSRAEPSPDSVSGQVIGGADASEKAVTAPSDAADATVDQSTVPSDQSEEDAIDEQAREIRRMLPSPSISVSAASVGRIAFYTAVAGDYDLVSEPEIVDARADYFLFTDQSVPEDSVWQARPFMHRFSDATRTARYVKLHPHHYFAGYDRVIWLDANLRPSAVAEAFVADHEADDIVAWQHPQRDCVYDEADECLALAKEEPAVIAAYVQGLRNRGYPAHAGLIESSVLVFKHQTPRVIAFLDDWWRAIESGSRRDQLSFNPTLKAHPEIRVGYLAPKGTNSRNDPRVAYRYHRGPAARGTPATGD